MMARIASGLTMLAAIITMVLAWPVPAANAEAGLQLNPLKYEDQLTAGVPRSGFVDVANPSDVTVTIQTSVQGFRQADLAGDLEFFNDPVLSAGITPGLDTFDLGPRESIRVAFTVDPDKLPKGGVYAAIFFRTLPPAAQSDKSFINDSANVGTLLLLQNGNSNAHVGHITSLKTPFWQFGNGLTGSLTYQNTNRNTDAIAFNPNLSSKVLPWGKATKLTGPYILPSSTRAFGLSRPGSYIGLLPVTVTDTDSGIATTSWVFAITGWYIVAVLIIGLWLLAELVWHVLKRFRRPKNETSAKRSLDGLAPTKKP